MQHKRIVSLLIAFLFFGRISHLQATQSNLSNKEKKVVLPTLALMFLNNTLSDLANTTENSDTTKDKLQIKRFPSPKRPCLDGTFQPLHTLPSSFDENNRLAKDILTPTPGDKVRLITGKVAQIKTVAPITKNNKEVIFSYTVALNDSITKRVYDEHLVGLQSKQARCERQLALGDVVLVKNDAKIVILDGSEDDLKPLDTKEITLNPGSVHKANPIGKVVYLDGAWVGLMQTNVSLSLPLKTKTNKKHTNEKVNHKSLNQQQLSTKPLSRPTRWLVPTSHIRCILQREKRYKVYDLYDKHGKLSEDRKHDLGLRYPLAARSPMGSLIYQTSSSKLMRRMAHFTDSFTHKVLLQGNKTQVLGTEQELLLPAYADGYLPSPPSALASGSLSLYNKSKTNKAWTPYAYTLYPSSEQHEVLCIMCAPGTSRVLFAYRLHINSALNPLFWCDKKTIPCRYGITLTHPSQQLVLSFSNERDRRIFYHALVWLTSPYVLAIEEVNRQPTGHTRLLACDDIKQMTLQQLAHHMQTQWLVREGTLHQNLNLLDSHFIFEKHQQQSLSQYYDWSLQQRYKKVHISLYRTSHPDYIARFGRYPQLDNQDKTANICPEVAKLMDNLEDDEEDLSIGQLHTEGCQGLCTYVNYLSGQHNNYTSEEAKKRFNDAKDHMWQYYHGRPTPCPNQSKCPYHELKTHQAECHRLLYSHAPRRIRAPQNLSHGTSPFKSQEDWTKARASQYQPSLLEAQSWESTNGYLQLFIHEQIANGYLSRWADYADQPNTFAKLAPYYKQLLGYKKDDPSMLNLSALDYLPKLSSIKKLFFKPRHQHMGYPLTLAELAAIYAYTAWDGLCSDFNRSFRQGNYQKWRWMDGLLHKGITKLSFLEDGNYPLYTGFKNIQLNKTRQHDQRWQDYTSSTPYPGIATTFHENNGLQITIHPSMRKSKHVPCCDVSWISPYPEEFEVLFARGIAGHSTSSMRGEDGWEVKVTGKEYQLQQISVWYHTFWQQFANHPLTMMHQLFGKSQSFNFVLATYHHVIDNLLSGQSIDVHQKLGLQKDQSLLSISAEYGHTVVVKRLLDHDDIKINLQRGDGASPLYMAAQYGHTDIVKLLLKAPKIKVNLQENQGASPLYMAAQQGHTDIVKLLLKAPKIKVNLQENQGASPLLMAAQEGQTDIVKLLLKHNDIDVNLQRDTGSSPLLIAAANGHTDIVNLLLKHPNINVNLQMNDVASALFIAATKGHTDIVKLLLKHDDINVNLQTNDGASPLFISAQQGHTDIVKLLLKDLKIKVNLQDEDGTSPLYMAAQNGHTDVVKLLLKHPKIKVNLQTDSGASPLLMAAQNSHTQVVKLLLKDPKIKVNLQMNDGTSPLLMAATKGHTQVVRLLLGHDDIKVNLQMNQGASPLYIAAQNGHTTVVKRLLKYPKINVNLQRNDGASALYIAAQQGHTAVVGCLLQQTKIDVNLRKLTGSTPLHIAAQKGHTAVVKRLLKYPKINVNLQNNQGASAFFMAAQNGHIDIVKLLLDHDDIKVNLQRNDGTSALYIAAQEGHTDVVKLLLKHPKIKVNLQRNDGASPLFFAATNGHTDVVTLLLKHDNIDVNLQTNTGASPLFFATQEGHTDVVKLLLKDPNIKVNLQRNDGASPLFFAATNGHTDIVKLLLAQPGIQVNLATKNPKYTPRDAVYFQMKNTQDPKVWDKYYTIRQLLIEKGGKLLACANAYPQPPLRPSNQQGLNVDMQTILSWTQNLG